MKKFLIASAFALALPTAALADVSAELTVASSHAGYAAKATAIDMVHMHLHHVVNCLVGPAGTGFDATNANPCAKAGNGAIPDSTDAAQKAKLQAVVKTAQAGIASTDLATAQKDASDAGAAIDGAK
jgi:hypothetical protein